MWVSNEFQRRKNSFESLTSFALICYMYQLLKFISKATVLIDQASQLSFLGDHIISQTDSLEVKISFALISNISSPCTVTLHYMLDAMPNTIQLTTVISLHVHQVLLAILDSSATS